MSSPKLVPVIDLLSGNVVRAVAGRRSEYQPLTSELVDSVEPFAVAHAMIGATHADTLYLADLDRIQRHHTTLANYGELAARLGVTIWADCGGLCVESPRVRSIISTESCTLDQVCPGSVVSLDLRNGEFVGDWSRWGMRSARDLEGSVRAIAELASVVIVLDVASVGTGCGVPTLDVCRLVRSLAPRLGLATGGGIRDHTQLPAELVADYVLISSSLHRAAHSNSHGESPAPPRTDN
jgi:phosphoribosylformimino-5-aminoimidazole carboxamide ribotide isomerase